MAKLIEIEGTSYLQLDNNDSVLIITDCADNKVDYSMIKQNRDDYATPADLVVNCFHDILLNQQELLHELMDKLYNQE